LIRLFLKRLGILSSIFVIAVVVVSAFDNLDAQQNQNQNIKRIQFAPNFSETDLIVLGNSYAYSGINPLVIDSLTDFQTYNLGTATAGPIMCRMIFEDYILALEEVKGLTVLFVVSPTMLTSKGDNFLLYPIHRYLHKPKSHLHLIAQGYFVNPIELYRKSFDRIVSQLFDENEDIVDSSMWVFRGFYENWNVFNSEIENHTKDLYSDFKDAEWDYQKARTVKEFASDLGADHRIVFVEVPTHKLSIYLNPAFLTEYKKFTSELDTEFQLLRLNLDLDSSFYRNIDHLNARGADTVSRVIAKRLNQRIDAF
jgi:hypothetical protein